MHNVLTWKRIGKFSAGVALAAALGAGGLGLAQGANLWPLSAALAAFCGFVVALVTLALFKLATAMGWLD